jgi:hypothetical protein
MPLPPTTRLLRPRISRASEPSLPLRQFCHFLRLPIGTVELPKAVSTVLTKYAELRYEIYRYLFTPYYPRILNREKIEDIDPGEYPDWPLPTAILCTNRQLYAEASHLMYSEVKIVLYPEDLVCLRADSKDIAPPSRKIWRHNPLDGVGRLGPHNERIYATPEMDGLMEPHIFARFQKVNFELNFEFEPDHCPMYRPLGINSEMKIERKERIRFQNFLRRTNILRDFKEVISNSYLVEFLRINLRIFALPAGNEDLEDDDGMLLDVYFKECGTRAVEMVIDSGIMDPLRSLTNVIFVQVQNIGAWDVEPQTLDPKYEQLLRELEDDIEGDWAWSDSEDEDLGDGSSGTEREVEEKDDYDGH